MNERAGRPSTDAAAGWPAGRTDVAVLDPDGPPGVSFIRALGSRGVDVHGFSSTARPAGRYSKHLASLTESPSLLDTDRAVDWLAGRLSDSTIGLVAPTSDYAVFAAAAAMDVAGIESPPGIPGIDAVWACLHKGVFDERLKAIGVDTVPQRLPTSLDDAIAAADELGYPVILKPRTHVGVGLERGGVVHDRAELEAVFREYPIDGADRSGLSRDPDLGWPLMQSFRAGPNTDVVSVAGCLGPDGRLWAVGGCRKLAQWPPGAGIGTLFETCDVEQHLDATVAVVGATLGSGIFELEWLVDHDAGTSFPIDLNPRAYGQVSLEVARGNDLPGLWYRLATGAELAALPAHDPAPEVWQSGTTYLPGAVLGIVAGPDRRRRLRELRSLMRRPRVGSIYDGDDRKPAAVLALTLLRHPGSFVRPFLPERFR